jgi:hypothetical protein
MAAVISPTVACESPYQIVWCLDVYVGGKKTQCRRGLVALRLTGKVTNFGNAVKSEACILCDIDQNVFAIIVTAFRARLDGNSQCVLG